MVGRDDGSPVGYVDEGSNEGFTVSPTFEGASVRLGIAVGLVVGRNEGIAEGRLVGFDDGFTVGTGVGAGVGIEDG